MSSKISFWKFLKESYGIVIPIIQRDYAQGRDGKEYVRESFLKQIQTVISDGATEGQDAEDGSCCGQDPKQPICEMDFVYGVVKNRTFYPLDGQQRLTTMWLLHWLVAYKSGAIKDDSVRNILKRFSYETRISSREFCEMICDIKTPPENQNIRKEIENKTAFYSDWKRDPTIAAMLQMLSGTSITNQAGVDIIDGIEELFIGWDDAKFKACWKRLTEEDRLVFSIMKIGDEKLPASDDLYIKMNARGKPLTDFENFKAELIDWIRRKIGDSRAVELAAKIDNSWTDAFWNNRDASANGSVDELFFAFLNRCFLNAAILTCEAKKGTPEWCLYGSESDDTLLAYGNFEPYQKILKLKKKPDLLDSIAKVFENLPSKTSKIVSLLPEWYRRSSNFSFIPKLVLNKDGHCQVVRNAAGREILQVEQIYQSERVVFHAAFRYLEQFKYDESQFKRWMRIVCNLVKNPEIDTVDSMIGRLRLIDELSEHANDIIGFLADDGNKIKSSAAKEQVEEERAKAKQIKTKEGEQGQKLNGPDEKTIVEAEQCAFFKGAIRFLFTDSEGRYDWSLFNDKKSAAGKYFDANGIKREYAVKLTKAFVLSCEDWENHLSDKQVFNPNSSTWKWILCKQTWQKQIHEMLTIKDLSMINKSELKKQGDIEKYVVPQLRKFPFEAVIKKCPEGRFRWSYGRLAFYKPYGREAILMDWSNFHRNQLLEELIKKNEVTIFTENVIQDSECFFSGWDINFKYSNHWFQWYGTPGNGNFDIYLLKDNWEKQNDPYLKHDEDPKAEGDQKYYYCSGVEEAVTIEAFQKLLDDLIKQVPVS
ncbi:MAG: DUF262 domain-containing protein [Opitutales bacterium]|nr:DUF262 domain-containing protein [Opitutales bacterium]